MPVPARRRLIGGNIDGPMKGRQFKFAEHDTFIVGRASDSHAHLSDDTFVSRHHFLVEVNPTPPGFIRLNALRLKVLAAAQAQQ